MARPAPATPTAGHDRETGILRRSFTSLRIRNYRLWFVGQRAGALLVDRRPAVSSPLRPA